MNRRFLAALILGGSTLAAAACGPAHSHAIKNLASPTSSAVASAEALARQQFTACQPAGKSASAWEISLVTSGSARSALVGCLDIPAGPKRTAFYSCLLDGLKTAMKAHGKAARETTGVTAAGQCVRTAKTGA